MKLITTQFSPNSYYCNPLQPKYYPQHPVLKHLPSVLLLKCDGLNFMPVYKKGKPIPVTGRGGPQGCETSRLPHFIGNRLRDGGEVVSLKRRPPFTPQEDSWYSYLLEAESTPGP
jgi:hypothetical protein